MLMAYGTATLAGMPACREPIAFVAMRAEVRILAGVVRAAHARAASGEHPVAAGEVVARIVMHGADDRELIGDLGLQRDRARVTSMPGTLVLIGLHMPRYSTGASGFISYISMWPGPPSSHSRITEVSFLVGRRFLRLEHAIEAERRHARHAELHEAASREPIAVLAGSASIDAEHGNLGTGGDRGLGNRDPVSGERHQLLPMDFIGLGVRGSTAGLDFAQRTRVGGASRLSDRSNCSRRWGGI